MKVLNLRCSFGHNFEGWFASQDDFQQQLDRTLIECPMCGDKSVQRLPSAPHVLTSSSRSPSPAAEAALSAQREGGGAKPASGAVPAAVPTPPPGTPAHMQSALLRAVQHIMAHTDDVGPRFAEEARRMHYGEADERPIRGQATPDEAKALHEEGIEVVSLPVPDALKGPLQ